MVIIGNYNQRVQNLKIVPFHLSFCLNLKLICTIENPRIKCVTEPKIIIFLLCKNLNSRFSTWLTHLILEVSLHSWLLRPTVWYRQFHGSFTILYVCKYLGPFLKDLRILLFRYVFILGWGFFAKVLET